MLCGKLAQYGEHSKMGAGYVAFLNALVPYGSFRSVAISQSMPPAQHGRHRLTVLSGRHFIFEVIYYAYGF